MLIHFSRVRLFATLWTVACQASLSMGFSMQEYWNRLLFSSPGDLSDSGIKPTSIMSPALADGFFSTSTTWEACVSIFGYEWCLIFPYPFPFFQLPSELQRASFFIGKKNKYIYPSCLWQYPTPDLLSFPKTGSLLNLHWKLVETSSEAKHKITRVFTGHVWYEAGALCLPQLELSAWKHSALLLALNCFHKDKINLGYSS